MGAFQPAKRFATLTAVTFTLALASAAPRSTGQTSPPASFDDQGTSDLVIYDAGTWRFFSTGATAGDRLIVDPDNPRWLRYKSGAPFFMCGPGDPEDFLYRGSRRPDGTRNGDQMTLINKLASTGANSIYLQAIRSHGGDGAPDHNPFIDSDPAKGLDKDILDQWETWFTGMDDAGIVIFFFFYDDSASVWSRTGDSVPPNESDFLKAIVNRFEHHERLIWIIAEEYREALSPARVSDMAAVVRAADNYDHPIAVHQNKGAFFDFPDDPNIDQFAMQLDAETTNALHNDVVTAFTDAAGRFNLNMAELAGHGTGAQARKNNWAAAMGGAYVMVFRMDIASTAVSDMEDCGRLVDFMESTNFYDMEPRDDLAWADTEYVLAVKGESYIAYSSSGTGKIGLQSMTAGKYDFTWLNTVTGTIVKQQRVSVGAGRRGWARPTGIGSEVAVYIQRSE